MMGEDTTAAAPLECVVRRVGSAERSSSAVLTAVLTLATILVTILPLLVVTYPPLHDYPFHIARSEILAHYRDWPLLQQFYTIGSFVLPNVAIDVVISGLAIFLPVPIAGRVFIAIIFVLLVTGTIVLHRVVHGEWSRWPLLSGVLLYNWIFLFGFVNYLFGLGLVLWGLAAWILIEPQRSGLRAAAGTTIAVVLFFAHLAALGIYAVALAGFELQRVFPLRRTWPGALRQLTSAMLPFAVPLCLLVFASPTGKKIGAELTFNLWPGWKPFAFYSTLLSGNPLLDIVTPPLLGLALVVVLMSGTIRIAREMWFALALVCIAFLVAPTGIMGALLLDARLPVAIAFIAVASTRVSVSVVAAQRVLVFMTATLLIFRAVVLATSWIGFDKTEREFLAAFDQLPAGSTLFVATGGPMPSLLFDDETSLSLWSPPLKHIASLVTLLKPIFVPATWADPTQQPIAIATRYLATKQLQGNNPIRLVTAADLERLMSEIDETQRKVDRNHSAYLLLLYPGGAFDEFLKDTTRIASGSTFVLLAIDGR
jgi:hypothetical protein